MSEKEIKFVFSQDKKINYKTVESIPLYRDVTQLIALQVATSQQMPKMIQATLCKLAIQNEANMLRLTIKAHHHIEQRISALEKFLELLEETEVYVRLIMDNSQIAQNNMERFHTLLDQLGKQANGWLQATIQAQK